MMIIDDQECIVFRCPKTASTTTRIMLHKFVPLTYENHFGPGHVTPTEAVEQGHITEEKLLQYRCVSGLRDPKERRMSEAGLLAKGSGILTPDIVDDPESKRRIGPHMKRSQEEWFKYQGEVVCEPLWFDDFDAQIRALITSLGGTPPAVIPHYNRNVFPNLTLDDFYGPGGLGPIMVKLQPEINFYNTMLAARN